MKSSRVPVSSYRIQLSKDFRFVDARDLVPCLHALGVGDFYCPPRFAVRRGSSHGYDVTNADVTNSELGTETDFDSLCEKLQHYDMGLLLDIVPNHMVASHENPWWMDVLENGPSSAYGYYFENGLTHDLGKLAALDRHARDVPVTELMRALVEVSACLPVYRTYIQGPPVSGIDRRILEDTLDLARRRTTELAGSSSI